MTFQASAEVYDRHVGRYAPQLSAALVQAAGVRRGDRALDIGCGPGGLTRTLAQLLGPEHVAAVDPSAPFVEACRERLPDVDVRLGSAEDLPFADDSFDAVLSQLVVNFLSDPQAGLGEMRRVTRPGGTVAGCVWDYEEGMTMLRSFWDAALEVDPAAPDEGRTMRFCRPDELRDLWEPTLDEVQVGELVVEATYDDFDDYWSPFPHGVAPSARTALHSTPKGRPRCARPASVDSARRETASP